MAGPVPAVRAAATAASSAAGSRGCLRYRRNTWVIWEGLQGNAVTSEVLRPAEKEGLSPNCAEAAAAFGSAHPADAARAFTFAGPHFVGPGHTPGVGLNPD